MRLDPHQAVDHLNAGLFELPGPGDVLPLIETGLQLDHGGDLLSATGGLGQSGHHGRAGVRPIQRLLDGDDILVFRCCLDELHHRHERVVRAMQQNIAAPDDGEDVVRAGQLSGNPRIEGLVLEPWLVDLFVELEQVGELERTGSEENVFRADVRRFLQELDDRFVGSRFDLQADDLPALAAAKLRLQGLEQILNVFFLDGEVGVADGAEGDGLAQLHPREKAARVRGDDIFEQHETCCVEPE